MIKLINGNCLDVLKTLEGKSINCCITSPPYWGLRDYGTASWVGGDPECEHWDKTHQSKKTSTGQKESIKYGGIGRSIYKNICKNCGAKRIDNQLGLEETPEKYVENMVNVFREVKRVLKDDGTLWLNLGDTYNGSGKAGKRDSEYFEKHSEFGKPANNKEKIGIPIKVKTLKPKDLIGIPWRVAFALQADGWYLRQDIIWHKPNPMPESVTDRCTKSHEYIFLLSKNKKYYYDNEVILEPFAENSDMEYRKILRFGKFYRAGNNNPYKKNTPLAGDRVVSDLKKGRNKRSVWTVTTKPYKEAHFATFPEDLILPCVLAGCPKDGMILDPFMGAGTTGVVAKKNNRNFIGIELNNEYLEMAKERIKYTLEKLF